MITPRIAFNNRMWKVQDLSFNPYVAMQALNETARTSLAYGYASSGAFGVYASDNKTTIDLDKLYEEAVSLSLGVFTIQVPHTKACNRLICNCKIM